MIEYLKDFRFFVTNDIWGLFFIASVSVTAIMDPKVAIALIVGFVASSLCARK